MKYIIMILCLVCVIQLDAQTTSFTAKQVNFHEVNQIKVVQHTGSQITIENGGEECRGLGDDGHDEDDEVTERSKGLQAINAQGLRDNTGLGLYVEKSGDALNIRQISANTEFCYLVKVPSGTNVFYEHSSHHGEDLHFEGLDGELEVTATFNDVYLKNLTGAMSINTIHGAIEGVFAKIGQTNPISIRSVHEIVDITVPKDAKANFRLLTSHGEIFTDLDLEVEKKDGMKRVSSNDVMGKFNGGGVDVTLSATYDNIYLRKG